MYIRATNGCFVEWGTISDIIHHDPNHRAYGPDVHEQGAAPHAVGIFGLTHEELLQSEWVESDVLTAKFMLEVRPYEILTSMARPLSLCADVPRGSLNHDMKCHWEDAASTDADVEFRVQQETLRAHSQILRARSTVLKTQLAVGMEESTSSCIKINDCSPLIFNAFLHFLYTDDLGAVAGMIAQTSDGPPYPQVQELLAVSHKYEVTRLQRWCEVQLSEQLTQDNICSVLGQAHLLGLQLEKACLAFINSHIKEVLRLPSIDLINSWPQLAVTISLMAAGVDAGEAALSSSPMLQLSNAAEGRQTFWGRLKCVCFGFNQTLAKIHVFNQLAGQESGVDPPHALSERGQIRRMEMMMGKYAYDGNTGQVARCHTRSDASWTAAALGGRV